MPRGKQELKEYLQRCLERVERVPDDEPWSQIRFPRQEAKKRVSNERKSKRIVIVTEPTNFSEFHAEKERITRVFDDNPTMFGYYLVALLRRWDDEEIRAWYEEVKDAQHVMGTDEHVGE